MKNEIRQGDGYLRTMRRRLRLAFRVISAILRHPANRQRRARAVFRGVRWQLVKRFIGPEVRLSLFGADLILPTARNSVSDIYYFGEYFEWENLKFCERVVRCGDVVIDGGANIGMFTYALMSYAQHGLKVYAFEPDHAAAEVIRNNVSRNYPPGSVEVIEAALGAVTGTAQFRNDLDVGSRLATEDESALNPWVEVNVQTLDYVIPSATVISLLKLDVEGSELEALKGASRILAAGLVAVIVVEGFERQLAMRGTSRRDLFGFLAQHGYSFWRYQVEKNELIPADLDQEKPDVVAIHVAFMDEIRVRLSR